MQLSGSDSSDIVISMHRCFSKHVDRRTKKSFFLYVIFPSAVKLMWAAALSVVLPACNTNTPQLDPERIVLSTRHGDLVLALYPEIAPRHVAQVKKLVRLGAYDSTYFFRIEPGFLIQITDILNRLDPLTDAQRAAHHPLPAEFSTRLRHRLGTLSMARWEDPDSATSSFSILLGPAPHLDGHYTLFGHVENGGSVLEKIVRSPRDGTTPLSPVVVTRAYIISDIEGYYARHGRDPVYTIGNHTTGSVWHR